MLLKRHHPVSAGYFRALPFKCDLETKETEKGDRDHSVVEALPSRAPQSAHFTSKRLWTHGAEAQDHDANDDNDDTQFVVLKILVC